MNFVSSIPIIFKKSIALRKKLSENKAKKALKKKKKRLKCAVLYYNQIINLRSKPRPYFSALEFRSEMAVMEDVN